jgi:hypothetical protein
LKQGGSDETVHVDSGDGDHGDRARVRRERAGREDGGGRRGGEGQKKLDFLVGTFDVKVRTWVDPAKPPFESTATSVATWVLGNRYVQQMLAGYVMGEPWSGIGYAGFDNTTKTYVATFMDSGSTGMEWYTGTLDAAGKVGKLTATVHDELTGKPLPVEMRLAVAPNGDHVTEMWQGDLTGKLAKVMELQYTRRKP